MSKTSHSKTRCSSKVSRRLIHWTLALLLLPCLWAVLHQTGLLVPHLVEEGWGAWWIYLAGMLSYVLVERFFSKPMWLYVVGHELTHALSGVLSGAKIHSFKAKSTGGEVRLSKSNAFIALSPYIIPLYAVGLIIIYVITRHWWNSPHLNPVFQWGLGMALAFHISLTFAAVHRHQPDLKVLGLFLSGVLILLGNTLVLGILGISLFSKTPSFSHYFRQIGQDTLVAWKLTGKLTAKGFLGAHQFMKEQAWIR